MKNIYLVILFLLICLGCSKEKTDAEMLQQDKAMLEEKLDVFFVQGYKFVKICIRASGNTEMSTDMQAFNKEMGKVFDMFINAAQDSTSSISPFEYLALYRDFKKMQEVVKKHDEDDFPCLMQVFSAQKSDSLTFEKLSTQNIEHAMLSIFFISAGKMSKNITLYESSKIDASNMPPSEIKMLLHLYKGFTFFKNDMYYLAEAEFTENINCLNDNNFTDYSLSQPLFKWDTTNTNLYNTEFKAINHMLRGVSRLMMDREIDEQRALQDFEAFIADAKKIGFDNEILWAVETYYYSKTEQINEAITALKKLQNSELLSNKEKESIAESITYLENRTSGKKLNKISDKVFISKVALKYMFSTIVDNDWRAILKEKEVPYTDETFNTLESMQKYMENIEKMSK